MKGLVFPRDVELGKLCRAARKARGWTGTELGRRLGKSAAWVSLAERGGINLSREAADEILRIIGARLEPMPRQNKKRIPPRTDEKVP